MRLRVTSHIPVLIAVIAFLAAACTDGPPTSVTDASAPNFSHKPGHNPGGGGGGKLESTPLVVTHNDSLGDKVTSDGRGSYVHGDCGVRADFPLSGTGDVTMDPDAKRVGKKERDSCGGGARFITLAFDDPAGVTPKGPVLEGGFFMNVNAVESVTASADDPALREALFHSSHCRLEFGAMPGSDSVQVWRIDAGTWGVRTQDPPNDVAGCADGVRSYYMPFGVTVTLKQ
jgi:hypothetical protein